MHPNFSASSCRYFHVDMKGTVIFGGSASAALHIRSGVKKGCVLAPTLFGFLFAVMLTHAFGPAAEGIYLRNRTDGKLFHLSRLRAKTKVQLKCLPDFLLKDLRRRHSNNSPFSRGPTAAHDTLQRCLPRLRAFH